MDKTPRTALLIGATGLVGKCLLEMILKDDYYSSVIVFSRKPLNILHPKLTVCITEFSDIEELRKNISGQDLFCCIGTTRKKSRNKQEYRFVDYEIPVRFAMIAKENGVKGIYCISSIGADPDALSFYLRLKGEMEQSIRQIGFEKVAFLRPSLLMGKRDEKRVMEDVAVKLFRFSKFLFFGKMKRYKPIKASTVAKALLTIAKSDFNEVVFENIRIKEIAGEKL